VRHELCGAKILIMRDLEERSRIRREAMETHRTTSLADAEAWDLDFWQRRTPEERLSALVAIHRDIAQVEAARDESSTPAIDHPRHQEDARVLKAVKDRRDSH